MMLNKEPTQPLRKSLLEQFSKFPTDALLGKENGFASALNASACTQNAGISLILLQRYYL